MAFYNLPTPWNPGYAIPEYVLAEPPGRGTFTTGMIERGTIDSLLPNVFGAAGNGGSIKGKKGLGSLGGAVFGDMVGPVQGLGAAAVANGKMMKPGFRGDPIAAYGKAMSSYLTRTIVMVDPDMRKVALKAVLDELDPKLWASVAEKAEKLQAKRLPPKVAFQRALAAALADGFARELIEAGKTGRIQMVSQTGLGSYGAPAARMAMAGVFDKIKGAAKKVGSAITGAGKAIGKGVGKGVSKAASWGKKAIEKFGSMACGVLNSGAASVAAGAAAGAVGVPPQVGVKGAEVGQGFCKQEQIPPASQQELHGGIGLVPILIGGAALAFLAF